MKKSEVMQLQYLLREVEMYRRQIGILEMDAAKMQRADRVKGSMPEHPYSSRSYSIQGIGSPREYCRLRAEIAEKKERLTLKAQQCKAEHERLQRSIEEVPDSLMRQLLTCRFVEGNSWAEVARKVGGNNTADSVRKAVERFFRTSG